MPHLFDLHAIVRLESTKAHAQLSEDGFYEVIRLLPEDVSGNFSYRLKSSAGERIAQESQLTGTVATSQSASVIHRLAPDGAKSPVKPGGNRSSRP